VAVGGAKIAVHEAIELPAEFVLVLNRNGTVNRRCQVVWRANNEIGVSFIE
jgi:hypothetical protein